MSSLDYASLSDNVVREFMVLAIEMPETFELMDQITAAGECAARAAKKAGESSLDQAADAAK